MIIWSGLGILIPLIAIAGMIAGTMLAGALGNTAYGPGLGLLLAAFANWGLWKMVYPKKPKVLVDPQTGRQVLITPKHGLFFIPARAWTWILAVIAIPVLAGGGIAGKAAAKEAAMPGYSAFKAANDLIGSKSDGAIHGNSDAAKQAAAGFSSSMKTMTGMFFSGGSKKNLMTGGDFLTYCQDGADSIVILCHVPSLRSYKSEESKKALADIAWNAAAGVAEKLDPDHKKSLLVGLRGIASYGSIQQGKTGAEESASSLDTSDKSVFFPAFVETPAIPEP